MPTIMSEPAEYNILCLGETQSGKSTLIESLKKYADPDYVVNKKNIGDSIFSLTKDVIVKEITTASPAYYITKAGVRIDYGTFIDGDTEDYEDELDDRKSYQLEREATNSTPVTFNLIDTPGLNDTTLFDESNIAIIFKALAKVKAINLVVITISNNPFTEGLRDALQAYVDLLPEFNGNVVFVHTRIDYARLHPDDKLFSSAFTEKKKILNSILKRDSVPHLLIDNDIGTKKVVRDCITQNTLRNLLGMAKLNQPIPLQAMRMNKTEKMRIVDNILKDKCEAKIDEIMKTLGVKNEEQKNILSRINSLKAIITEREDKLSRANQYLSIHDNEALELLHEEIYQQDFSILNIIEGSKPMYYPGKKRALESGFVHHKLDHIDIRALNVKILQEAGGQGHLYWAVRIRRRKAQNGLYHARIYIHRKKKFDKEIQANRVDVFTCQGQLEDHYRDLEVFQNEHSQQQEEMKILLDDLKLFRYMLGRVISLYLDSEVFHQLVAANVYVRNLSESALKVEKFYADKRDELERMESNIKYVVPLAISTSEFTEDLAKDLPDTPGADGGKSEAEFKFFVEKVAAHTSAAANTADNLACHLKETHLSGPKEA
ncbi:hypothetical protein BG003_008017 [Podila horticola]|nr:hypothetical protein BG003_008017 [Podila horticola]